MIGKIDPKEESPLLSKISRLEDSDTEYVGVKFILGGKDLYVYTVYSQPNKQIDLQGIKLTPESWIICGDFNSHSLS